MKKIITPNLLRFAVAAGIATLLFRMCLSHSIESQNNYLTVAITISYTIAMSLIGWHFGKKDRMDLPLYDVGFRFHLAAYLMHNLVSEIWYTLELQSRYEHIKVIHFTGIAWGFFLMLHFILFLSTRNKTINNINKDDLFE
jgi:hypothetical protein